MKKLALLVLAVGLITGVYFGARTVDRMALAYLTGQRRVAGQGFWGADVRSDGPVPGYAFLGFTRPSENPLGMRILRPLEMGREMGLEPGDVVTAVDGRTFRSAEELMRHLVANYLAGQVVSLTAVSAMAEVNGQPSYGEPRELTMTLRAFLRHPGDLELPFEEVEISSGSGHTLRGWFVPPPERSDGRVGVFVHGANSSRFQALEHGAEHWYRRGYGLLTMDLSGRGTSDGAYISYTINERHDVASMVQWARQRPDVDPSRVVVFGTSNGGAAAIYAAASDPDLPALALDAPYANLWDAAGTMLESRGGHPILRVPLFVAVRLRTGFDLWSVRPEDVVTQIRAPVLFVHGDADRQVPVIHSERMHKLRRDNGLPSELWVLPGGEHGFDNYPPEGIFWNRVLDFLDRALGGAPPAWQLS
jgi:alpha-beta hydrolase superfamily lysophospholipase